MNINEELLNIAKDVSNNAYVPYSKFKVGAAILYESSTIYTGCNVENSSYGLALCAERNAISTAIAKGEKSKLLKIAIFSPNSKKCFPCGACRQWLSEFEEGQNIEIIVENNDSQPLIFSISELLPYAFNL